jgi:hypothetical protein
LDRVVDGFDPDKGNWLCDIFSGDIEGNQSEDDSKPDEERNDPGMALALAFQRALEGEVVGR